MAAGPLVVTYPLTGRSRAIVEEELDGAAEGIYLIDLRKVDRANALERAAAVLSNDTSKELRPDEIPLIRNARLLQFTAAGVDWVPTLSIYQFIRHLQSFGSGRHSRRSLMARRRPRVNQESLPRASLAG